MITTRPAIAGDLNPIARLFNAYREFYDQPADPSRATEFIRERLARGDSVILVAERADSGIVGFCQLYPTFCSVEAASIYVLYDLFIAADQRRSGAARALLLAAEAHAAAEGRVRMDLSTARTNRAAQALYESLGWVRDDVYCVYNRRIHAGARS